VEAAAPFSDGHWLFSHNGRIDRWPSGVDSLVADVPPSALLGIVARTDSALLWLLVQRELERDTPAGVALATVAVRAQRCSPGRYNMLLHDGEQIVATAAGDTLFTHQDDGGITVASEPADATGGWRQVPEGSVVVATKTSLDIQPLERVAS
jgi:glutamine amidotransferase